MSENLQRYALDKMAPGMFKHHHGQYVKHADALAAVDAAVAAERARQRFDGRVLETALAQAYALLNEAAEQQLPKDLLVRIRKTLPPKYSMSFQHATAQ